MDPKETGNSEVVVKPTEGEVETQTPTEGGNTEVVNANNEPSYTEIEQEAIEQGWVPLEKWEGNPKDHRSAAWYIDRGEMLGKLKNQGAELREVKQMLSHMAEHNKKVYASGYQKAIADLKLQKIAAMKDENFEAVAAIEDAIEGNKEALAEIQRQPVRPAGPQINKELADKWLRENKWYTQDLSMKHWANGMAYEYSRVNPGTTEEEIYEYLGREVRKEFPQKFKRVAAPNPDGDGKQSNPTKTGTKNTTFDKLLESFSEEDAMVARKLVKTGVLTKEKYVEDYSTYGGRQ